MQVSILHAVEIREIFSNKFKNENTYADNIVKRLFPESNFISF